MAKGSSFSKSIESNKKGIAIGVVVIVIGYFALAAYGVLPKFWANAIQTDEDESGASTCIFNVTNFRNIEIDDADSFIYRYEKPDDFAAADEDTLLLSDFELYKTLSNGQYFTPDSSKYLYRYLVNCSGYQDFQGIPHLGTNTIILAKTPTTTCGVAMTEKLDTTIANTTESELDVFIRFTDAEGLVNNTMGYRSFTNLTTGIDSYQILVFDFNSTSIEADDVTIDCEYVEKVVSSDKVIFAIYADYFGQAQIHVTLDEHDIHVDADLDSISYAIGSTSSYVIKNTMY